MESSCKESKEKNKDNKDVKFIHIFKNLKSNYILQKLFVNIPLKKRLIIVKINKKIQNRLNLSSKDYKAYSEEIEIEIIPTKDKYCQFIKINENDKLFYHIYFNDNKEEIKNKYEINKEDKVTKIKIIIDYQVKSFKELLYWYNCIESINFKRFYRNNVK